MRLFTSNRVVKSRAVEVSAPCLVESQTEEFQFLANRLYVVHNVEEELVEGNEHPRAQAIILEAEEIRARAELLLQAAQAEAAKTSDRVRAEAEESLQKLREEVTQQAYQEGHAQGFAQGYQEGSAQGEKEAEQLKREANDILKLAQRAAQEELSKVDETLLRLALKVAERVVRVQVEAHPEQLIQRIRALSLLPEDRKGWKLHVSSADYQWFSQCSEEIMIPLLEDQTLNAGDCFLECAEGIFDARVEAQLERCEQLLREELRHDKLE